MFHLIEVLVIKADRYFSSMGLRRTVKKYLKYAAAFYLFRKVKQRIGKDRE